MSIGDILTLILGSITIIGTAIAIVRWYKNNSVKNVTQKFNNDKIHDKIEMKLVNAEKDYKTLLERQLKLEEEVQNIRNEIANLRGRLE